MPITTHTQYCKALKKSLFKKKVRIKDHDTLLVIDMQNDFIDRPYVDHKKKRLKSGKLPTYDSKVIIPKIVKIIEKFQKQKNSNVIATRDYHPGGNKASQHCSFPIFGEHCVWRTKGSDLVKEIERKLIRNNKFRKNCWVVFKAFHKAIDSFGAFKYRERYAQGRICGCTKKKCPVKFTGAKGTPRWVRYPNMKKQKFIQLSKIMKKTKKKSNSIFICGVLGDFCVLDSAINARQNGYKNVYVIVDTIRNLRIVDDKKKVIYPTTPKKYSSLAKKYGFKFIYAKDIKR